jgi:hypothetical protein
MNPSPKFLVALVVVVLVLGGAWYFMMQSANVSAPADNDSNGTSSQPTTQEEVIVTKVDTAEPGVSKLPAGFPSGVPVEQANVSESYRVVYSERGVTQYTVSYTSLKGRDALWDIYNDYLKSAGYSVDSGLTSKNQGQISGNKDGDSLSVIISQRNGVSFVQLNLLYRQ